MKLLDDTIAEFTKSTKSGFSFYLNILKEVRAEFDSLNLSNHTLQIDNEHKQEVIEGLDAELDALYIVNSELMDNFNKSVEMLKLEQSRTWWNKLWNKYPKLRM